MQARKLISYEDIHHYLLNELSAYTQIDTFIINQVLENEDLLTAIIDTNNFQETQAKKEEILTQIRSYKEQNFNLETNHFENDEEMTESFENGWVQEPTLFGFAQSQAGLWSRPNSPALNDEPYADMSNQDKGPEHKKQRKF